MAQRLVLPGRSVFCTTSAGLNRFEDTIPSLTRNLWTPADNIVGHICLAFELVYPASRRIARKQGYVDRLLTFESDNPDTARWCARMREHLWEHFENTGEIV